MRVPTAAILLVLLSVGLAGCGDVGDQDEDGDGIYDETERDGWSILVDTMTERNRREVTSDPHDFDTDDDGLPDQEEFFLQSDPRQADTDGDGLTDCQEVRHTNRTQCEDPDFAGPYDGGYGTDPNRADSDPGSSVYVLEKGFTDHTGTLANGRPDAGDGIGDGDEVAGYSITLGSGATRYVTTDPRDGDSDGDDLGDGDERFLFGSDPTIQDTDGDGCRDGLDPVPAFEELYGPGLDAFTVHGSDGVDLRLSILVANARVDVPATGSVRVEPGQTRDLSGLEPVAARPDRCDFGPRSWVFVQIRADDVGADAHVLDIHSQSPGANAFIPSDGAAVYWNVHEDRFSWSQSGTSSWPASEGVVFEGADGRLALRPAITAAT